jgi:hypothetical protein
MAISVEQWTCQLPALCALVPFHRTRRQLQTKLHNTDKRRVLAAQTAATAACTKMPVYIHRHPY